MIDEERKLVAITPHAASRSELSFNDILLVDMNGKVVEAPEGLHPTSELLIHLSIYKKRTDVRAVCHTHAEYASVFAGLSLPIKPVLTESMLYGVNCPLAPFGTPSTQELADNITTTLSADVQAVIMEKHGLLTVGSNIYDAYLKSVYVEEVAKAYYRMISLVGFDKVNPCLSDSEFDRMMNHLGIRA